MRAVVLVLVWLDPGPGLPALPGCVHTLEAATCLPRTRGAHRGKWKDLRGPRQDAQRRNLSKCETKWIINVLSDR